MVGKGLCVLQWAECTAVLEGWRRASQRVWVEEAAELGQPL